MALAAHRKHRFSTVVHTVVRSAATLAVYGALWLSNGCSKRGTDGNTAQKGDTIASPLRVALLTPGPISDQSWNGGAYQGLLRIRDSLGASISHIQTKTPAEFEEQFRQYGSQG